MKYLFYGFTVALNCVSFDANGVANTEKNGDLLPQTFKGRGHFSKKCKHVFFGYNGRYEL